MISTPTPLARPVTRQHQSHVPGAVVGRPARASIIVVAYNSRSYLDRCLRSLIDDAGFTEQIILVDNASTDGSADAVEQAFPEVLVVRSPVNLGYGGGCNFGARYAAGRDLAFLNPDTVVEPGWLESLLAALDADPQAGLATPKILLLNNAARINTCGNDVHCSGLTLCRGMGMERDELTTAGAVSAVSGAAFVIRRDLFEQLNGFDESFFMYMEDTDLSWRASLLRYRCVYVPDAIVYHDYALRFGPRKTYYQERNRYLMLVKVLRWRTLIVLMPALILAEIITWGFVLVRERRRLANKLRAYAWLAAHWREVTEQRRQTQSRRRASDRAILAGCTYRLMFAQTGDGPAARLASVLFDPLFLACQRFALAVTRW